MVRGYGCIVSHLGKMKVRVSLLFDALTPATVNKLSR